MNAIRPFVIGGHQPPNEFKYWILYLPGPNQIQPEQLVSVTYGNDRCKPQGPCLEPKRILDWVPYIYFDKPVEGKLWEPEPPGWFRRKCEAAGCLWFFSMVERMAAGEDVSIEEIGAAYSAHNEGKKLEKISIGELR